MRARTGAKRFLLLGAFLAVSTLFLALFCVDRAEAIPAFSRNLKTECTTCHTVFPQLNEFGHAFRQNGFVWPGGVPMSKKVKVTQTEEERKSAEYINLSGIPAVLPVSVALTASYLYNDKVEDDFDMKRYSAEIFGAGALGGDRIGFWFNESLGSQSGGPTGPSELFFVARQPLGAPLYLKAGRFSPNITLWETTLNGRLLSMGASVDGFAVNGTQSGLELSSFLGPRVLAVVGMNDRNNSSDSKNPHSVNDFYGRLAVKFGGADYHAKEPDMDLDKDSVWDYLSVSLSAFAYNGSTSTGNGVDHDLTRYGVEAEASYKKALLMLGATVGENSAETDDPLKSTALSAEINYILNAQYAAGVRIDSLDVDGKDLRTVVSPFVMYAPLQCFRLRLSVASDSNPSNAATDKAVSNTTATLTATLAF